MPELDFARLNHAHALMYAGEADAAKKIYLDGARHTEQGSAEWRKSVRKDFAELTARKLSHPLMATIETEMKD
jgi:hypothetical protein